MQPRFIGFVVGEVANQPKINRLARVKCQLCAHRGLVFGAEARAARSVSLPGAALFRGHGQAPRQTFGERTGEKCLRHEFVVRAIFGGDAGVRFRRRSIGDEIDFTTRGVAAVQGALRTAQYFDAIDIEQLALTLDGQSEGHIIEADADGGCIVRGVVQKSDSANAILRQAGAKSGFHLQTRHRILQVIDVRDGLSREIGAGQHRERNTDGLRGLCPALRGDYNFFETAAVACGSRHRGPGKTRCVQKNAGAQSRRESPQRHSVLPDFTNPQTRGRTSSATHHTL